MAWDYIRARDGLGMRNDHDLGLDLFVNVKEHGVNCIHRHVVSRQLTLHCGVCNQVVAVIKIRC